MNPGVKYISSENFGEIITIKSTTWKNILNFVQEKTKNSIIF